MTDSLEHYLLQRVGSASSQMLLFQAQAVWNNWWISFRISNRQCRFSHVSKALFSTSELQKSVVTSSMLSFPEFEANPSTSSASSASPASSASLPSCWVPYIPSSSSAASAGSLQQYTSIINLTINSFRLRAVSVSGKT